MPANGRWDLIRRLKDNYECSTGCFYLQLAEAACGSQLKVFQRDGAELKTDGVQASQKSISAYKKTGVPSQVNVVFPRSHYKISDTFTLLNLQYQDWQ